MRSAAGGESKRIEIVQILAAIAVGLGAYLFSLLASQAQAGFKFAFGYWSAGACAATPLLFLGAAWLVRRFGPDAAGSGIPEVLRAVKLAVPGNKKALSSPLVSLRTALVKVASALLGYLAGASIGEEGPTVHISASILAFAARRAKRQFVVTDSRSFLVAGAAAGIAAAFNTPLAGIVFALEEVAESIFSQFKIAVMLCVIVADLTVRALAGDTPYFGHVVVQAPTPLTLLIAIAAGLLGGLFGGLFSKILTQPHLRILPRAWWLRALACGSACAVMAYASHGNSSGPGHELVKSFVDDPQGSLPAFLFPEKFLTTVFSYLSGMAGGIFSPCLAIGAGMGLNLGQLFHSADPKTCVLMGMTAFFAGVVHAPLTAAIIVMEMTHQYELIIPLLTTAFLARGVGALIAPIPLYRRLAFPKQSSRTPKDSDRAISS